MNLINEFDGTCAESGDELSTGCLSSELADDSSDENSADHIYPDYFNARNYSRGRNNWLARHRAILDRAYNIIYDEASSSESTTESESFDKFDVGNNYCRKNEWDKDYLAGGNGENFSSPKKLSPVFRSRKIRDNSTKNLENPRSRWRHQIFDKKVPNFEDRSSVYRNSCSSFDQRSRVTSGSQLSDNLSQSLSNSSDFSSENLIFQESFAKNKSGEFLSKKYPKMGSKSNSETTGIHRKRKLFTPAEFRDRSIYSQDNLHRKNVERNYHVKDPSARISRASKLRQRLKPIPKMRKIYSEQILLEKFHEENNEALFFGADNSSSDDNPVIDVEEIPQENIRGKHIRFIAETVLLEINKYEKNSNLFSFEKSERMKNLLPPHNYTSESHANEVKLLGEIKRRIDEDFECDLSPTEFIENSIEEEREESSNTCGREPPEILSATCESGESGENLVDEKKVSSKIAGSTENRKSLSLDEVSDYNLAKNSDVIHSNFHYYYPSLKSSRQNFVDSIDSGVSTDFSRNESDLLKTNAKNDNDKNETLVIEDRISIPNDEACLSYLSSCIDGEEEEELLEERVDKAVEKFTEELIMFERRAIERGLLDEIRGEGFGRKRKKPFRKTRYGDSSSPKTCNTLSSPRDVFNTSQSSGEEEYLENISPPSLISISDSDV